MLLISITAPRPTLRSVSLPATRRRRLRKLKEKESGTRNFHNCHLNFLTVDVQTTSSTVSDEVDSVASPVPAPVSVSVPEVQQTDASTSLPTIDDSNVANPSESIVIRIPRPRVQKSGKFNHFYSNFAL